MKLILILTAYKKLGANQDNKEFKMRIGELLMIMEPVPCRLQASQ